MHHQFTTTFNDLKFTLHRYGHCYNGLQPLNGYQLNETEFLIHQIKVFLDEGNYDNEQLANVSMLMDNICRPNIDTSYPISVHIDVNKFANASGKQNRCNAIDDAMDSMYYVFRRSALNRSEPLDFSVILFYPNETDRSATYNLTDLINTSWIKSETILEHVCGITTATKNYIQSKTTNSTAQARSEPLSQAGRVRALIDYFNSWLDPILGLQKRLYWESTNRLGQFQSRVGSGFQRARQTIFGSARNSTTTAASSASSSSSGSANRSSLMTTDLAAGEQAATPVPQLAANRSTTLSSGWFSGPSSAPSASLPPLAVKSTTAAPSVTNVANNK